MVIIQSNQLALPARLIWKHFPRLYRILNSKPWFVALSVGPDYVKITDADVDNLQANLARVIAPAIGKFIEAVKDDDYWNLRDLEIIQEGFQMITNPEQENFSEETIEEALYLFAEYYRDLWV